jgi:hypothetical protein
VLPCPVLFAFVGLEPDVDYMPAGIERDPAGALVAGADLGTSQPGLWVIGAARSGYGGTLTHASADAEKSRRRIVGRDIARKDAPMRDDDRRVRRFEQQRATPLGAAAIPIAICWMPPLA